MTQPTLSSTEGQQKERRKLPNILLITAGRHHSMFGPICCLSQKRYNILLTCNHQWLKW